MSHQKANDLFVQMQEAALDDLLKTSDEIILREAAEDGVDVRATTAAFRERVAAKMAHARRTRLLNARDQLNAAQSRRSQPRARPAFQQLKQLVVDALQRTPAVGVAFRQGQRQSEADWESMYDDLVDLGVIPQHDDDR